MKLDSYTCENCILPWTETIYHLFFRCSFATRCWLSIGVIVPRILYPQTAVKRLTEQLGHNCAMEIVILMAQSIWKCHNGWIFYNIPPTIERCRGLVAQELKLLRRLKPCIAQNLQNLFTNSADFVLYMV
jgi:hypothetical protein